MPPPSHEETKFLAQSTIRSLELRGRVTTCVLGSVIGRTQALVGCYIRRFFDRFVMVRFQPCKMCRPMLFRTLIPIKRPFHALPFHCRARWSLMAMTNSLSKAMNDPAPCRRGCVAFSGSDRPISVSSSLIAVQPFSVPARRCGGRVIGSAPLMAFTSAGDTSESLGRPACAQSRSNRRCWMLRFAPSMSSPR